MKRWRPSGRPRHAISAAGLRVTLTAALLATAVTAQAQAPVRILLVSDTEPAFGRRLQAEAQAAGLRVIELGPEASKLEAARLLELHGGAAVVRLTSADRAEIHLGLSDGAIARTLTRRDADGEAFALRVVEEVYARLVELKLVEPRSERMKPGLAALPQARNERELTGTEGSPANLAPAHVDRGSSTTSGDGTARLWLSAGFAGTQPAGSIGGTVHAAVGARLEPARRWVFSARALFPLTENNLSGPEGSADVRVNLFLGDVGYTLFEPAPGLGFDAGLGAGILVLAMEGEALEPFAGQSERTTAAVYYAHADLAWRLSSWLRIRAGVLGGVSAPRPVVRFDGREVASWGRPFAGAAVSSEFGLALSGPEAHR